MPNPSKPDVAIAQIFAAHHLETDGDDLRDAIRRDLAHAFARYLAATTPRFHRARFLAACKVTRRRRP